MQTWFQLLSSRRVPQSTLYVLVGGDTSIHQDVARRLMRGMVGENADLNTLHLVADDKTDFASIEQFCEEFPMLANRRLAWIEDAQKLPAAVSEAMVRYLDNRNPSTVLVLSFSSARKESGRGRKGKSDTAPAGPSLMEAALSKGVAIRCELVDEPDYGRDERVAWMQWELQQRGITVEPEALRMLGARVHADMAGMRNELDKLHAWLGHRTVVTAQDVSQIVLPTLQARIQELPYRLKRKDVDGTLKLYRDLLASDVHPLQVLSYVQAVAREQPSKAAWESFLEADLAIKEGANAEVWVELILCRLLQAHR